MGIFDDILPKQSRGFWASLGDNILGFDDEYDTPGERLGRGINDTAKALWNDPMGVAKSVKGDMDSLMFQGGAMQRPQDVLGYAAAPMAPGAMVGIPAGAIGANGIRAFHGSPHSFDKFSMDAIGTGEGAQAYGHGLYFAENEGVARGYRDALTGNHYGDNRVLKVDGQDIAEPTSAQRAIARFGADEAAGIFQRNLERAQQKLDGLPKYSAGDDIEDFDLDRMVAEAEVKSAQDAIAEVNGLRGADIGYKAPGSMYEVRINANPDEFLDWDAPLSEQGPQVQKAVQSAVEDAGGDWERVKATGWTGGQFNRQWWGEYDQDRVAADLAKSGAKGIKYKDAGSRGMDGQEGTRNFVVFDENLIEIVRKYGVAGAAAMLGVSAQEVQERMNGT